MTDLLQSGLKAAGGKGFGMGEWGETGKGILLDVAAFRISEVIAKFNSTLSWFLTE